MRLACSFASRHRAEAALAIVLALSACTPPELISLPGPLRDPDDDPSLWGVEVEDVAVEANYQGGRTLGHLGRGRTALVGDLDADGWPDVYIGNPGDPSYVLLNRTEPGGPIRFEDGPVLSLLQIAWGGGIADLDNDGDNDLLVTGGGNEEPDLTRLFRNQLSETGSFSLLDKTIATGVGNPLKPDGTDRPLAQAHASVADFDNDGVLDLFINGNITPARKIADLKDRPGLGENVLWLGGAERYVDVTEATGLVTTEATQNSTALDFDGDGDMDLYENTLQCDQHIWRNLLVETGELRFEDATAELSLAGGDLRFPQKGFSSVAADFNLDGWEDVLVFVRAFEPLDSPYQDGHVLLLNIEGRGFVDVAPLTGINQPFVNWEETLRDHTGGGVMGSTVGDVNADGIPDVYVGQGGPPAGTTDIFFLSTGLQQVEIPEIGTVSVPVWENASDLVDFPAPEDPEVGPEYPPYPYRTHAINFVDFDRDGVLELTAQEGGPSWAPDIVREPDRLFRFAFEQPRRWLAVQLAGNGTTTNRSAIGARVDLQVRRSQDGASWTLSRWLHGGNGFAANNGLELYFGLADADEILDLTVRWPDGAVTRPQPPQPDQLVRIDQQSGELELVVPAR